MKGNVVVQVSDRDSVMRLMRLLSAKLTLRTGNKITAGSTLVSALTALESQLDTDTRPPSFR